jgi:DNA/RNA endonuclease G (NUC1)
LLVKESKDGTEPVSRNYYTKFLLRTFRKTGLKKDRGVDVETEMGDVFSYLFQLAYMLNVDLDHMWLQHKEKVALKFYKDTNINGVCSAH